ncbi:MAG: DUF1566 domain-containing protein [Desulfobacteraceae bacterium]|nr:DUF1566 domain-containing protein [Desulfobacteraceae bacterium]
MTDTGQTSCYSASGKISFPSSSSNYYGQDAQYKSNQMSYKDNDNGTVSDLVTGLMWSKAVDETKVSLAQAHKIAASMTLGGYSDWRVPNIKELYSLMNFSGNTGFNGGNLNSSAPSNAIPYINTDYFDFRFGNTSGGERYIDAQWLSSTKYVSRTMNGSKTLFGVNFADGRIKGYGYSNPRGRRSEKKFYARYVRGNSYGNNSFKNNNNGTITDTATGLMWMKFDSGKGMDWDDALKYAENFEYGGYNDWRLPNAKELQYIVDYSRSPDTTNSAAIDSMFDVTSIRNESLQKDFPYFWTSTTHLDGPQPGKNAVYISFGRAMGKMRGANMDVHGAGAQRSDPKSGQGNISRGPQGDWVRVNNYVRLVRGGSVTEITDSPNINTSAYPLTIKVADTFTTFQSTNQMQKMPSQEQQRGFNSKNKNSSKGMGFVSRLDMDGDEKVSQSEFDGPSQHFSHFDRNNDGFITEDEAPKGPPPQRGRKRQ